MSKKEEKPEWYVEHSLPPRDNRRWIDYPQYPFLALWKYVKRLYGILGWQLFVFLIFSQFALKGILYMLTKRIMLPLFKNALGLEANAFAIWEMIAMLPWAIKPILGLFSDIFIIGGYHKRYWLFLAYIVGVAGSGLFFLAHALGSAVGVALCVAGIQFQISLYDLMSEGRFSVITRECPYTKSDIQTFTQTLQACGMLVAVTIVGILSDYQLYIILFIIIVVISASPLWPTLANWISEEREVKTFGCTPVSPRLLVLIIIIAIGAPLAGALAQMGYTVISLSLALGFVLITTMGTFFAFGPQNTVIGRIAAFQVITYLARPSLGSAMDYFYTSEASCLADGPHFSLSYYIFIAGLISTIAGLFGIAAYSRFSNLRFRTVLIVTSIIQGIAGLSDLFIVWRWNTRIGIPDKAAYLLGEAIIEPVIATLNYIPVTTLLSKACLPGFESSIYALLAGLSNFCGGISEISGSYLYTWFGVNTATCDFHTLGWLILACHVISPIVSGVAASFLIPNIFQDESLFPPKEEMELVPLEEDDLSNYTEDDFQ